MNENQILACAKVAHEANRIYCEATGDTSQVPFDKAPDWQRESAVNGVRAALSGATPRELHEGWCAEKQAAGWQYGAVKDADAKTHPCLVPYAQLPPQQQAKDRLFGEIVRAMATAVSLKTPENTTEAQDGFALDEDGFERRCAYGEHAIGPDEFCTVAGCPGARRR